MKIKMQKLKRASYAFVAMTLVTVSLVSGWSAQKASAAQITSRFIRMSQSAPSATNVVYFASFNVATTGNVGGVVIDFCSNSPIIGDPCTELSSDGFDINETTTAITSTGVTDLAIDAASDPNTIVLTSTLVPSITAGNTITIQMGNGTTNGFTNRTTVGTFYARVHTYATAAGAQGHIEDASTGHVDTGGVALSTATVINITARVQETLSFCVFPTLQSDGVTPGVCGDPGDMEIGHDPGSGTRIIDSSVVDTSQVSFYIATNANSGAVVRLKGDTLKDSQGNDINPVGATAAAIAAGTENFGLRLETLGTLITDVAPYDGGTAGAGGTSYALDVTSTTDTDVTATYGAIVADLSGPTDGSTSVVQYGATASVTTAAGTYTAAHQYICTGTF